MVTMLVVGGGWRHTAWMVVLREWASRHRTEMVRVVRDYGYDCFLLKS